jgi:membrane fusion protein, multidrug efflux system
MELSMRLPRIPRFSLSLGPVIMLGLAFALVGCGQGHDNAPPGPGGDMPPAPVTTVEVRSETVELYGDYAGRLHGSREAEVRARVGGILEQRLYEEGEVVEQGAPLFRIDPAPYRIALQRSQADKATAAATVRQAEREWQRVSGLFEQGAVSERERDRALSDLDLGRAQLARADAGLAQARLDLEYTTVTAPIAGVTGLENVTEGNLLAHGALLTTVTQLDPIQVRFALPASAASSRRGLAANGPASLLDAELLLADGTTFPAAGTIDFTASTVDPATGNVVLRAQFPNPDYRLVPGALARVRIVIEQLRDVYRVDPEAVSQGAAGPVVYVVEDGVAKARAVRLGPEAQGKQIVLEGLNDGDRVVVNGQVALRDGARVNAEARAARSD